MGRVRKFLALPPAEKWLLLQACLLVTAAAVGLRVLKLERLRRMLAPRGTPPSPAARHHSAEEIARAVDRAGRILHGTCVPQAIAAEALLKGAGYPAHFHVGVSRDGEKGFQAHAWVESNGVVAAGGAESPSHYASLAVMD